MQTVPVATAAAVGTAGQRLMGFYLYGGSAATSVEFKNAATDTGTVLFSAATPIAIGQLVDLTRFGGIPFDVGIFCKPAGAGSTCYVWVG